MHDPGITLDISLTQLRRFVALSESRTFTAGAEMTNRSQAAFSRSIAALESSLGVVLIDRMGHHHELTPIGRTVLEHARHMLAEADKLTEVVHAYTHEGAGSLSLGLAATPSAMLTSPLLHYAAAHSGVMRLRITPGRHDLLAAALRDRKLDALVVDRSSVSPTEDLDVTPIAELRTGFLCRPGHPLAQHKTVLLADLLRFPIASTTLNDNAARYMIERYGPKAHPSLLTTLHGEDIPSLLAVASSTDALFMGVLAAGKAHIKRGELQHLKFDVGDYRSRFALIRLAGRSESALLTRVRAIIAEVMHD